MEFVKAIKSVNRKRLVIRLILLVLLVAFGFVLYYIGKEHELLLDNKTVSIGVNNYEAAEYMKVTIDGNEEKSIELYADDRDIAKVSGPRHVIKVEIINEETEEVIKSAERSLSFGRIPALMISLPAIAADAAEVYLPLPGEFNGAQIEAAQNDREDKREDAIESGAPAAPVLSD